MLTGPTTVTKKWSSRTTGSCTCQRGFVLLCYNQIKEIMGLCLNGQKDILWPKLEKVGININLDEKEKLTGKSLLTRVMRKWWPASDALLEAIIVHFPSPAIAQKYRAESLYSGPLDDVYASAITGCNPDGPLMLYVSKMIPSPNTSNFFAFGRVFFSGRLTTGLEVRIMGPNYLHGGSNYVYEENVKSTHIWMCNQMESIHRKYPQCRVRESCCFISLENFVHRTATITTNKEFKAHSLRNLKFHVAPVMRMAVQQQHCNSHNRRNVKFQIS
ncbi:elongation factor 2 [Striga asiatica]|uniref:Elongation factor 2 n=1 Tax=Striga asiatica TaxID=4170 RepID=A0A5A7NZT4_STRAF|nr:elongation factor 2 [Striga asiatica]